ncbi:MAG: AAA family ATPase [Chloroflexota bacterium]
MNKTIILIGPMGAGKTTVGRLLSERLGLKNVSLDEIRQPYYDEAGYDNDTAKQIHSERGMAGILSYWKPFETHSVERVLQDYENCMIDFGAGHSVYDDEVLFKRVKKALDPYPNVVLLLPSANTEEAIRNLNMRIPPDVPAEIIPWYKEMNAYFVKHHANADLAKITVYTQDRTPDETCDEIIGKLK